MKPILDISYYQSPDSIDYDLMSAAISGVIIRAAYGSGVPNRWQGADITFERHYAEFTKRGVPVGAYQFITEYQPLAEQVGVAMNAINGKTLKLGFWADVELENNAEPLTKSTVDQYLMALDEVVTGIYTSKVQWQRIMGSTPYYNDYKLWVAHYGASTPWLPQGANGYWLWQNHGTETGRISGYARGVDLSQFYGTQEQFDAWVNATPEPEPEPEPVGLPYEASVTAGVLNVRASAGGTIIGKLNIGNKVTVYEEAGDWARVNAWVSTKYIKRVTNLPPTPPPSGTLAVEPYSQNDPRWKNNKLGTSSTTIGWNGCLITCCAMVMKFYGADIDPATLNAYLTNNNGYDKGNLLWWGRVPNMSISTWVDCLNVPAPLSQIDACLGRGEPVIVHVDFVPSTSVINDHYVLIVGKRGDDDYWMADPWTGTLGSFRNEYGDPVRWIFRVVSYRRQA